MPLDDWRAVITATVAAAKAGDAGARAWLAHLSEREHVLDALQLLVDLDRLAVQVRDTGGRMATIYEANPKGFAP